MSAGPRDACVDAELAEYAVPVVPTRPLVDRAVEVARMLTATPRRAALATAWGCAVLIGTASLLPTTVTARSSFGPARARCGLDIFLYGDPDRSVASACRQAEAGRLTVFVPCLLAILAGAAMAAILLVRMARAQRARAVTGAQARSRLRALAIGAGTLALLVSAFALRPAETLAAGSGNLTTVRCGADTYFFGYPNGAVDHACRRAYAGHAHVLIAALVVGAAAVLALAYLVVTSAPNRGSRQRRLLVVTSLVFLAGCAVSLLPLTVRVSDTVYARCGLDTYLAGHPDHAVQAACRSAFGKHAATGFAAGMLALVTLAGTAFIREHPGRPTDRPLRAPA